MDSNNMIISPFTYRRCKSLELNKRIFLSHSGQDKPFVRKLNMALKQRKYDAFFDEESLPKAKIITMKEILEEVKISELCVFVLSDAFFTLTKNPMLEVISFLVSQEKDPMKRLLPLFYKLSVPELKEEQRQCTWIKKWEEWEKEKKEKGFTISGVNLEQWKSALKIISDTSGLEIKERNEEEYIEFIVSHICQIIPPDVQHDVSYVQGKERMCKEVESLFVECQKDYARACILGIHGLGGLGKTSLSKVIFNYYWPLFKGRVIRIDLNSSCKELSFKRLCMVLKTIHNVNEETLASLHDVDEGWHIYLHHIGKKKVFLIIDNANDLECKEEIRKYLKGVFHRESKILILSRSKTLLEDLCHGYPNLQIAEIPSLRKEEVEAMFMQTLQIFGREHELSSRERDIVRDGIELCIFEGVYHPMAVLVLGSWMKHKDWEEIVNFLSKHRTSKLGETVIHLLEKSFNDMEEKPKKILIDLALYRPSPHLNWNPYKWLSCVNQIDRVEVNNVLTKLRDRAFLCGDGLEIHGLVKELAILATSTRTHLGCVYFDKNHEVWEISNNVKMFAMESYETQISKLSLKGFPNLRVVKIKDTKGLKEIEMDHNMVHLQSLEVSSLDFMNSLTNDDRIKSKKKQCSAKIMIKGLACCVNLRWMSLEKCVDPILVQPQLLRRMLSLVGIGSRFMSLHSLRMATNQGSTISLKNLDKICNSLEELELDGFDVGKICHLPKFSHLRKLSLVRCLWTHELHFGPLLRLEWLNINYAPKLKHICGIEGCTPSLETLTLVNISSLKYLCLNSFCHLIDLYICNCRQLHRLDGLEKMDSLKHMSLEYCNGLVRLDGFHKLNSLESMLVNACHQLVTLEGLEKIGSMKRLSVHNCDVLVSLFVGVVREDEETISSLVNLQSMYICDCPHLIEKFGIVNVKSFERVSSDNLEYVESILFTWNAFLRVVEEREGNAPTMPMHRHNITRYKQELVVGAILQPQTILVASCCIPYHMVFKYLCDELQKKNDDDYVQKSMEGFLKMLMVALCWSSKEKRMNITKQLQASKCSTNRWAPSLTMHQYLSRVHPTTLLTCLVYLGCHHQNSSFLLILQMAGDLETIFQSWDHENNGSLSTSVQHGILLLTVVGILWPHNLPILATHIARIYFSTLLDKEGKSYDSGELRLPIDAKDVVLRLFNEENVQREFQIIQKEFQETRGFQHNQGQAQEIIIEGEDNLEVFNRLLLNIPCCDDLECFLSYY